MNKTIQKMAHAILDESGTIHTFQWEATHTTMNILSKAHLGVNNDKTTYELWYEKTTTFKNFRTFLIKCYIENNDDNLRKFESRPDEQILLRYSSRSKGYNVIIKCFKILLNV